MINKDDRHPIKTAQQNVPEVFLQKKKVNLGVIQPHYEIINLQQI